MRFYSDHINLFLYQKRTTVLINPRDVTTFCSIVHPSVTYLDLSVGEYGRRLQTTDTERTVRRLVVPYTMEQVEALNLDSPQHFDQKLQVVDGLTSLRSQIYQYFVENICVMPIVYIKSFDSDIIDSMKASQNKMSDLRKYLKAIKLIELLEDDYNSRLYECFLSVLVEEECEDSELLMEFVELCGHNFITWLLHLENERLLEYVLHHTHKLRCDIFKELSSYACPVGIAILTGLTRNMQVLLKYGFNTLLSLKTQNTPLGIFLPPSTDELEWAPFPILENRSQFRLTLLIHLFHLHYHNASDRRATAASMRMLWRSLPVCFLDREEVTHAFRYTFDDNFEAHQAYLAKVWEFYEGVLRWEDDFRPGEPRKLAHQCRFRVRSVLKENFALPGGVYELGLPPCLVSYLNLEY